MGIKSWWKNWRSERRRVKAIRLAKERPLREFVYLDETSVTSLLVSQTGTVPETVSHGTTVAEEAELSGKLSAGVPTVGKAESGSRYQTSNSSTVQISRKAVVQSVFRELRDLELNYVLKSPVGPVDKLSSAGDIATVASPAAVAASRLERGELVEIDVVLEVHPVFRMGTMISEFTAMVEEWPAMSDTAGQAGESMLRETQPVSKLLQRLLAGLIPISAKAVDYSVVTVDGCEYVAHNDAISDLNLPRRPLMVVGVTEHLGYWKDIRRVLFSSGRFTMLCRVSRDGLQDTWTPVKLADLFGEIAPSLVEQINVASRAGLEGVGAPPTESSDDNAFTKALFIYRDKLLSASGAELSTGVGADLSVAMLKMGTEAVSASKERQAFASVRKAIEDASNDELADVDADADLRARQEARSEAGVALLAPEEEKHSVVEPPAPENERLLDVEVVAIYW
ncbi:DUF6414 family protein [Promicromonospora soli]